MRKALMGLILAATILSPVAAEAQRGRGRDGDGARAQNQNEGDGEARAARQEQRQQQREARQAQQQQVQQQQVQQQQVQQQQAPPQVVQRERGGNRGGDNNYSRNRGGDNNYGGNRGDGNRGYRGDRNAQPSIYPQAWQGNPNDPRLRHYQELERRNQQRGANDGRRGDDRRDWRGDRNDRRDWRGDRNDRRGNWDRGWRNDRRYDWQNWRYSNRNIFRIGPYYSPYRGYGYNRFSIGFMLEPLFYSNRYWIGDPWQYRLPPAYPGTQWVRYYNDVLLVDIYSGEVLDVIYDFFY